MIAGPRTALIAGLLLRTRDVQVSGCEGPVARGQRPSYLGVAVLGVTPVNLGHLDGHWAVDVYRKDRDAPRRLETAQHPQQLLRPIHREGRDQDGAAARRRVTDDPHQLVFRTRSMGPIAVRGLEQQYVGRGNGLGVREDRPIVAPEVARVHQPSGVEPQLHRGRPQDVPRLPQQRRDTRGDGKRPVVPARLDERERRVRVLCRVERQRRLVL